MTLFRSRVDPPPSQLSGAILMWCRQVTDAINAMPTVSFFSGLDPGSSGVSGMPGHIAINFGSASTDSRLFIHGGAANSYTTTEWKVVRIA